MGITQFALGEEIGWRGFLLEKLYPHQPNFLVRALMVGIIWGFWHCSMYLRIGLQTLKLIIFLVNVCILSVVCTYLYERKRVIWPTVIFHASHNFIFNATLPIFMYPNANPIWFGEEGLLVSIAYSIVIGSMGLIIYFKKTKESW